MARNDDNIEPEGCMFLLERRVTIDEVAHRLVHSEKLRGRRLTSDQELKVPVYA